MAANFTFENEQVWVVEHNLYTRTPVIDCWVDFDGTLEKVLPKEVRSIDLSTCEVHWTAPRTGEVRVA